MGAPERGGRGTPVAVIGRMTTTTMTTTMAREQVGWRTGKPVEDPDKTKRWGFVTAKPSEFLVHCRRGRVLASSGQGATCWKWPWDSVAVVPTSFQKVAFVADQITLERVGVGISGLAVYRIAEPLLAYRVLNFSYPERAQEKLEETLTDMLMGATRRLVANLTVDECLQKRKAALADELLREIAPVLGGAGRPGDETDQGWGVVLDTVEIQEVRILSGKVFDAMQAPFRAALDRQSREARADANKRGALAEAGARREVEEATIDAEAAVRARRSDVELREEEGKAAAFQRRIELALENERARVEDAQARQALLAAEAQAEIDAHEIMVRARELAMARERMVWVAEHEKRRAAGEVDLLVGRGDAEVALARAHAAAESASAQARVLVAQRLPDLAQALGQRTELKLYHIGGIDGIAGALQALLRGGLSGGSR